MNGVPRDLACHDIWNESLERSRARRLAAAQRRDLPLPSARGASVAAALVVAGGSSGMVVDGLAGSTDTAAAATNAKVRHRGGGVAEMQRKLGVPADGVFGPQTERALRRWQRRKGLTADGIAGPMTRRAMGLGSGPALKRKRANGQRRSAGRSRRSRGQRGRSHRGGGVRALQRKLGVPADGAFGPQTERAVRRFQRRRGLVADGVVGPATRRALGLGSGPMLKRKSGNRGGSRTGGGGGGLRIVQRVIAAGNRIARTPYKWGGGHGSFNDTGYDCSGSVSYALHGGGLLRSPLDSSSFMSYGQPGPGRHITIYANSGHMYMVVNGRRFDTSARSITGSRWTNEMRSTSGYVARHPAGL